MSTFNHNNGDTHSVNGSLLSSSRNKTSPANQTKFAILIASPKSAFIENLRSESSLKESIKAEASTPPHESFNNEDQLSQTLKKESVDPNTTTVREAGQSTLSRLIFYLHR